MKFVYPEFLWALLALLIPVIIHLFNFRRYKTLYFSSLKFLRFVDQQTRSTQKLKHLIVLILRLLALASIIIAFAQPYFPVENNGRSGGKPVIAIYIDNSFSMTAKGTEGELISEAREFARNIIRKAPVRTAFLINTNLLSGIEKRLLTQPEALEYLDKIEPGPMVRQLGDVVAWMKGTLDRENESGKALGSRQYLLLSDFQRNTTLINDIEKDDQGYYYPILFSAQEKSNLYIDSAWYSSPMRRIGTNNELNLRIVNESETDLTNVEVSFSLENIKRDIFIDVPAKDRSTTSINYTEKGKGEKKGKITVNDRQLFWDDDYYFSYAVDDHSDVLIINGEDASPSVEKVYLLESYYRVKSIPHTAFTLDEIKGKELVILNGITSVPDGMTEQLISFAEEGGSIALIPAKQIETAATNNLLRKAGMPGFGKTTNQGTRIRKIHYDDPFFFGMFDKRKEELNLQSVSKAFTLVPGGGSGCLDLITFQNGQPLLMRSNSSFNFYLFTISASPEFGTFTSESLYPSLLLRIGEMSQKKRPISLTLGSDALFPLYDKINADEPVHLKNGKIDFIPRMEKKGLTTFIVLNGLEAVENLRSGNYNIVGESEQSSLSLNYSRAESSTDCKSIEEISNDLTASGLGNVSASVIDRGQSVSKIDIDKPFEYWRLFIILALVFLVAEMLILKLWK
jgi:hypothetical protein